jgi:membrane protease YdiL (CAAX protease family)
MKTPYPTINQSIGIVGILIGGMLLASPVLFTENLIGKGASFFLYYVVSMAIALAIVLTIRKNKTQEQQTFHFEVEDTSVVPFIMLATLGLIFGITAPLTSLIPVPDFFKKILLDLGNQTGLFSFLTIVIAAPVLEELIFRGIILDGLLKRYNPVKAILFSSFLFGFIHLNPWQFVGAGILGIFMGWIYYRTRSVALTIIIHLTNNLAAFSLGQLSELTMENIDEPLMDYYGGIVPMVLITTSAIVVLVACVYYLHQKMNPSPQALYANPLENAVVDSLSDSPDQVQMETTRKDAD